MRRIQLTALVLLVWSLPVVAGDSRIDSVIEELEDFGKENPRWNVPPDHGRFLWLMTELTGAKRVLEIGTSNGYSSLWIAKGLRKTGGKLITIEFDKERANEAKANFAKAGCDDIIVVHNGDAFKVIPKLKGPFDLIFLDAWKKDYKKFFDLSYPLLRPGGVFLGHNAVALAKDMQDYLDTIRHHPQLITNIVQMGKDGFAVSYRRRPEANKPKAK